MDLAFLNYLSAMGMFDDNLRRRPLFVPIPIGMLGTWSGCHAGDFGWGEDQTLVEFHLGSECQVIYPDKRLKRALSLESVNSNTFTFREHIPMDKKARTPPLNSLRGRVKSHMVGR